MLAVEAMELAKQLATHDATGRYATTRARRTDLSQVATAACFEYPSALVNTSYDSLGDGASSKMEAGVAGDDGSREIRKEFSCPPSPNCIFSLRERCIASVTKKLRPGWKIQRRNSKDNVANHCTSQMRSADKGRGKISYPPSDSKYKAINGLIRIRCVSVGTKR